MDVADLLAARPLRSWVRSTPVVEPISSMPWATFSATVRDSRFAPSVEMTVILSMAPSGSAALATTCGSTSTSIWTIAASP